MLLLRLLNVDVSENFTEFEFDVKIEESLFRPCEPDELGGSGEVIDLLKSLVAKLLELAPAVAVTEAAETLLLLFELLTTLKLPAELLACVKIILLLLLLLGVLLLVLLLLGKETDE